MTSYIKVIGAKEHNLKNVNIDLPRDQLVVITGISGSGKSSLAFDTVYAEGQRRYVESLSAYARQFLHLQDKPDVESIEGLSPAIAIQQKTVSKNPRSTVGTVTEIYDYMRLLFARIGIPYSPETGKPIISQTVSDMVDSIMELPKDSKIHLLSPFVRGRKGEHLKEIYHFKKQGFTRINIDGTLYEIDEMPVLDKNKQHNMSIVVDRLVIKDDIENRLVESIETALQLSDGIIHVEIIESGAPDVVANDKILIFSEKFSCPVSGFCLDEIEPRIFSFNSPHGACHACNGLGFEHFFDPSLIIPDESLSLTEGAIHPWRNIASSHLPYQALATYYNFSVDTPFRDLEQSVKDVLLRGSGKQEIELTYDDGSYHRKVKRPFEGIIPFLERRDEENSSWTEEELNRYRGPTKCHHCDGFRLKKETLCIKIQGKHIGHVSSLSIADALKWAEELPKKFTKKEQLIAVRILRELQQRLSFLYNVGLEYLTLERESGSLSGGESQRIRLASQIGSGLSGVLYVLDEPSIGLHQCDNQKLLESLKGLRDLGNTVLVVEHDEETIAQADYVVDVGPGAGVKGGHIIAAGTPSEIAKNENSITGQYLSGRKSIEVPQKRRTWNPKRTIRLKGARDNNLDNVDAEFPLAALTCVTGVSGSGKSTLTIHTLYKILAKKLHGTKDMPGEYDSIHGTETIDKIIEIDQSPIGRTPRSNPATYTGAFAPIRDWFASLAEAKARGYRAGRFSFNVKGGRCEACQGDGLIKIEMHFLPDVYVKCETCRGKRYNRETLQVTYKGKSIADILDMNVTDGVKFFEHIPAVKEKLVALEEVGLSYIKLGQSATTLSGGEAQRIKLAKELSRRSTGRTLYILDEPTTGLHSADINKLLNVLHKLVDGGNTMVIIEHNLDVIKTADHIIDVGPRGGTHGGKIIATGTPEEIIKNKVSITAQYLAPYLTKKKAS